MTKNIFVSLPLFILFSFAPPTTEPTVSNTPLSAEQMQIYKSFLDGYLGKDRTVLNLARETEPLIFEDEGDTCIKGLKLRNIDKAAHTVHVFDVNFTDERRVRLVDPKTEKVIKDPEQSMREGKTFDDAVNAGFAAGLLSFSEIVFDESHHYAVFRFSFVCGRLCGHGGIVVYERKKQGWQLSKRNCSPWIS